MVLGFIVTFPPLFWNHALMCLFLHFSFSCVFFPLCGCIEIRGCILPSTRPLRPSKASPLERPLKATSTVAKWDGPAFGAFLGPGVLSLRHDLCRPGPLKWQPTSYNVAISFFFSSFFGHTKSLGIWEAANDSSSASSKKGEKKAALWAAFGEIFELGQTSCRVVMYMAFKCSLSRMRFPPRFLTRCPDFPSKVSVNLDWFVLWNFVSLAHSRAMTKTQTPMTHVNPLESLQMFGLYLQLREHPFPYMVICLTTKRGKVPAGLLTSGLVKQQVCWRG